MLSVLLLGAAVWLAIGLAVVAVCAAAKRGDAQLVSAASHAGDRSAALSTLPAERRAS